MPTKTTDTIRVLSIDPSKNRTGYASAVFKPLPGYSFPVVDPDTGTVEACTVAAMWDERTSVWCWGYWDLVGMSYMDRLHELVQWIDVVFPEGFDIIILEWPMFFDIERGHVAAVRGDTINLAGINMFIAGWFRVPSNRTTLITAAKWKGSVSKNITMMRFLKAFNLPNIYKIDHNAVDAAMLLLTWCQRARLVSDAFVGLKKEVDTGRCVDAHK